MGILPNKSGLIIGSLIGSALGLLFAREAGKDFRSKLSTARTSQKKFEVLFQEYLRVGKDVFKEVEKSELTKELAASGKIILKELQKRAKKEGGAAVKFAEKKAAEILAEVEKQAKKPAKKAVKNARKVVKKAVKVAKKTVKKVAPTKKKAAAKKKPAKKTKK